MDYPLPTQAPPGAPDAALGAPLLDVRGATLRYHTAGSIVIPNHRVSLQVVPAGRFVPLGPSG